MGEAIITRRSSGAGIDASAFAFIIVTYPEGSTCTCTDGTTTLTANSTNGSYVFYVPSAATWTVKVTDGTNTRSKSVTITSEKQVAEVVLLYDKVILSTAITRKLTTRENNADHAVKSTDTIASLDLSGYNTLYVTVAEVYNNAESYGSTSIGVGNVIGNAITKSITTTGNIAIDVSGLTGIYTIALYVSCWSITGKYEAQNGAKISKAWLTQGG